MHKEIWFCSGSDGKVQNMDPGFMDPLRVYTLSSKHTYGPMRARVVVQLFYNVTSSSILSWQHKYQ